MPIGLASPLVPVRPALPSGCDRKRSGPGYVQKEVPPRLGHDLQFEHIAKAVIVENVRRFPLGLDRLRAGSDLDRGLEVDKTETGKHMFGPRQVSRAATTR